MGIKDKATYGENYWALQVEAQAAFDEDTEKAFAPYFRGILADLPAIKDLPYGMRKFVEALGTPPSAGFGGFALGVGVEMVDETLHSVMNPAMKIMTRAINRRSKETWLTIEQANTLFRQDKIQESYWNLIATSEGYEDVIARQVYESGMPYPSIPDLILYARYHGNPDSTQGIVWEWFDVPARDYKIWDWLGLQRLTTSDSQTSFRRGLIPKSELYENLAKIGWSREDRDLVAELGWTVPNAMLLVQGDLMQGKSAADIIRDISIADINPKYAQNYLDAILTKPASQDIIAYELRRDPSLSNIGQALRRIGIHDNYFPLYKELAQQIPPIADIITMAVREAFTPAIATKFGQYEDFPKDLEVWGAKKGLSAEWTQRYWAAHWSLPSPQQGFEMLHRGIITQAELDMLLRALDVMPFWRSKLVSMAYKRLTRVDIRRMYNVGVLTESQVYEAYLELGYNERDARRMSDFTVKQVLATQSKFTAANVITAYSNYIINRSEAASLLKEVGVRSENISFVLSSAEYKREWELTESRIAAIKNLYKKQVYTPDKARAELLRLDMPSQRVDVLMEQWYIDEKDKEPRYWTTAQTLSFIKAELITPDRGRIELENIGYDSEHINVYMESGK